MFMQNEITYLLSDTNSCNWR